jgi:hypothetical protein
VPTRTWAGPMLARKRNAAGWGGGARKLRRIPRRMILFSDGRRPTRSSAHEQLQRAMAMAYSSCHGAKSYIHRRRQMQRRVPSKGHMRQQRRFNGVESALRSGRERVPQKAQRMPCCSAESPTRPRGRPGWHIYHRDDRRSILRISVVVQEKPHHLSRPGAVMAAVLDFGSLFLSGFDLKLTLIEA